MGTPRSETPAYECPFNDEFSSEGAFNLVVNNLNFDFSVENPTLQTVNSLSISEVNHAFTLESPTLTISMVVDDLNLAFTVDNIDLVPVQAFDLEIDAIDFPFILDSISFQQDNLWPTYPPQGTVIGQLHPQAGQQLNVATTVVIGVTFPRDTIPMSGPNIANISALVNSAEQECDVAVTSVWRGLGANPIADSLRSVRMFVDIQNGFPSLNPLDLEIRWGTPRTQNLNYAGSVDDLFVSSNRAPWQNDEVGVPTYPATYEVDGITVSDTEPEVWFTLPSQYMCDCRIYGPCDPLGTYDTDPFWAYYDEWHEGGGRTIINNFTQDPNAPIQASDFIEFTTPRGLEAPGEIASFPEWQLERESNLHHLYIKTGKLEWLIAAHRATQFYSKHIRDLSYGADAGTWALKDSALPCVAPDLKYSYGKGMFVNMMLTGFEGNNGRIQAVQEFVSQRDIDYQDTDASFTERNSAYIFAGSINAWEISGGQTYETKVLQDWADFLDHQLNPQNSNPAWTYNGSMLHTLEDHEGNGECANDTDEPLASTWMSALFAEKVFLYYTHSNDQSALTFLSNFGDWIVNIGLHVIPGTGSKAGLTQPWYLVGPNFSAHEGSGCENRNFIPIVSDTDTEHAPDVMGLLQYAAWAKAQLNLSTVAVDNAIALLKPTCENTFDFFDRTTANRPYYRTNGRRWNWWFQAHYGAHWLENNR